MRGNVQGVADVGLEGFPRGDVRIGLSEVDGGVHGLVHHVEKASDADARKDGIHGGGAEVGVHVLDGRVRFQGLVRKEGPPDGLVGRRLAYVEHGAAGVEGEDVNVACVGEVTMFEGHFEGPSMVVASRLVLHVGQNGVEADGVGNAAHVIETMLERR